MRRRLELGLSMESGDGSRDYSLIIHTVGQETYPVELSGVWSLRYLSVGCKVATDAYHRARNDGGGSRGLTSTRCSQDRRSWRFRV